jgi:hypothetical protein
MNKKIDSHRYKYIEGHKLCIYKNGDCCGNSVYGKNPHIKNFNDKFYNEWFCEHHFRYKL